MNTQESTLQVLVGTSDSHQAETITGAFRAAGIESCLAASVEDVVSALRREHFEVMVIHTKLAGHASAVDLVQSVLRDANRPEVVVIADDPEVSQALALGKAGVFDYMVAPATEKLIATVREAGNMSRSKTVASRPPQLDQISNAFFVSSVPGVREMAALSRMVAARPEATALIVGESGSGKAVVARLIHWMSAQSDGPLARVNIVDVAPEDLDARLFGRHGVGPDRWEVPGAFAEARGGSLLLEEVSELPAEIQSPLLEVLETRRFHAIDSLDDMEFRARVLATTAHDVGSLVDDNNFQAGLFYRLASVLIRVPPLRERTADLPRLSDAVLQQVGAELGRPALMLSPSALGVLTEYNWPGNLRELRNVLTRAVLLAPSEVVEGDVIAQLLGPQRISMRPSSPGMFGLKRTTRRPKTTSLPVPKISGIIAAALDDTARAERERIEEALIAANGHRERAATVLGMSRTTLWTRMRLLGIDADRYRKRRTGTAE